METPRISAAAAHHASETTGPHEDLDSRRRAMDETLGRTRAAVPDILGRSLNEVAEVCKLQSLKLRIASKDGVGVDVLTDDFRPNRLTVTVVGGQVVAAEAG